MVWIPFDRFAVVEDHSVTAVVDKEAEFYGYVLPLRIGVTDKDCRCVAKIVKSDIGPVRRLNGWPRCFKTSRSLGHEVHVAVFLEELEITYPVEI
jgi:hypothetical protein